MPERAVPPKRRPARRRRSRLLRRVKVGSIPVIADVLADSRRTPLPGDTGREIEAIRRELGQYGISKAAIEFAVKLSRRAETAHFPNARLKEHGAELTDVVRAVRDNEVNFRAAYVAKAASRFQAALNEAQREPDPEARKEILRRAALNEQRYLRQHDKARRQRLESSAQMQVAGDMFGWKLETGTLVGWYLNPLLNNDSECIAANGHNFYVEKGTIIGYPGAVHAGCGCYAGPPHVGRAMVDDVVRKVVPLRGRHRTPVVLRPRKAAR